MEACVNHSPKNLIISAVVINVETSGEKFWCKIYKALSLHSKSFLSERMQCVLASL